MPPAYAFLVFCETEFGNGHMSRRIAIPMGMMAYLLFKMIISSMIIIIVVMLVMIGCQVQGYGRMLGLSDGLDNGRFHN